MNLREHFKQLRLQLNPIDAYEHALAAADLLSRQDFFKNSQKVGLYLAHQQEMSCQPLIELSWSLNKEIYLPVINEETNVLHFKRYEAGDQLAKNRFGIAEPLATAKEIAIQELDLVIMPLVAFDSACNRLGSGCGYYDRTFANKNEKPILCGLAYAFQQVDALAAEPWDVPMQYVVTDLDVITI